MDPQVKQVKHLSRPLSMNMVNQLNTPPETTTLQKVLIIFGAGVFIALCSLTASLPIDYNSHQPDSLPVGGDDDSADYNLGDTAWMLIAATFGILLTPALSFVYANLYGRTTSFSLQIALLVGSMIAVLWITISFSLVYAKDANGDQILGLPKYNYMFAHVGPSPDGEYTTSIPFSIFAIFELSFPLLASSLVVNSVIDRVNVYGLLMFIFIWHICVYTPIAHITWNTRGFFFTNNIEDFSGGLVVHMTAGITSFTMQLFLDWIKAPKPQQRKPTDPESILWGGLVVFFLWFGTNAGKANGANTVATQSIVNTIGGVVTAILVNYCFDHLEAFKFTDITLTNSVLIGLVSTAPSSGYVTVGGSMVIASITTLSVRTVGKYIFKEAIEDTPYSIPMLHGFGGTVSFLFTGLVTYSIVNEDPFALSADTAQNGLTYGIDIVIRHHTAAVLAMWTCVFLAVVVVLAVSNLLIPISKSMQNTVQSPKGEYAPSPLGPFRTNSESGYMKKAPSDDYGDEVEKNDV